MCRSIQPLFNCEPAASDDEIRAAALQFVRKISGYARPAAANASAFEAAVEEVTAASQRLLASLETRAAKRTRKRAGPRTQAPAPLAVDQSAATTSASR